jgi:hypothetical protein
MVTVTITVLKNKHGHGHGHGPCSRVKKLKTQQRTQRGYVKLTLAGIQRAFYHALIKKALFPLACFAFIEQMFTFCRYVYGDFQARMCCGFDQSRMM